MGSRNVFVVISRTIFCVFIYFMTFIVISLDYAIPLPHPKRVCEGLGGVTLPDVPAFCLFKRPRRCVSIFPIFSFPTVRAFVARTPDFSDSHCIGVPRRLESSSFAPVLRSQFALCSTGEPVRKVLD